MYADDFVLCGELEQDLRAMVGWFAAVCRRRGLKVNAGDGNEWRGGIGVKGSFRVCIQIQIFGMFWTKQVQMEQNVVGRWQVPLSP